MNFKKLLILPFTLALLLSGCNNNKKEQKEDPGIDYVAQARLDQFSSITTYENKNFLDNGVGEVTLYNPVDGDTAHFYQKESTNPKDNRLVKVRFYGIDTPESTGQIEPWGKKASKFTTEALQNAKTIVLTNGDLKEVPASVDSTGSRFKALVWVADTENAPVSALKCLNLWIVQEGYSNGKGVADCPLAKLFNDADLQAQKLKRHCWSGDDPDFYRGDAMKTSIKEIVEEFTSHNGSCPTFEGKKVQINGVVAKVVDCDAYVVQDFEDETTGEVSRYGLFIFAGYHFYDPLTTVGNDLTITGTFTVRYGNPQITSVSYNEDLPSKDDIKINSKGVAKPFPEMTFDKVDGKYDYVNLVGNFKHLHATGKGSNSIDKTTKQASGALSIELQDDAGNKMYLRVPKNIFLMEKNGGPLDRVTDYKYLSDNNLYFDLTAAIAVYDPSNKDEEDSGQTNVYCQLTLCDKLDVQYY